MAEIGSRLHPVGIVRSPHVETVRSLHGEMGNAAHSHRVRVEIASRLLRAEIARSHPAATASVVALRPAPAASTVQTATTSPVLQEKAVRRLKLGGTLPGLAVRSSAAAALGATVAASRVASGNRAAVPRSADQVPVRVVVALQNDVRSNANGAVSRHRPVRGAHEG